MPRPRRPSVLPGLPALALLLAACVAEPAPAGCETGRDCPRDAPWCVRGACAPDRDPADASADADPCGDRCAADCRWLLGCIAAICPAVTAGNPGLADEIAESCEAQCAVDRPVAAGLCAHADGGDCADAVGDIDRLLGFSICP